MKLHTCEAITAAVLKLYECFKLEVARHVAVVLVLVLVKIRQRAVLITPVCPMSYGRSAISRLLKISSEPASATAAGRLFQTGIVNNKLSSNIALYRWAHYSRSRMLTVILIQILPDFMTYFCRLSLNTMSTDSWPFVTRSRQAWHD